MEESDGGIQSRNSARRIDTGRKRGEWVPGSTRLGLRCSSQTWFVESPGRLVLNRSDGRDLCRRALPCKRKPGCLARFLSVGWDAVTSQPGATGGESSAALVLLPQASR